MDCRIIDLWDALPTSAPLSQSFWHFPNLKGIDNSVLEFYFSYLARLIHEFAENFHNFIFYNQLCNLGQKSLFRWNNWQVQYLRQFLRFYEFFGLGGGFKQKGRIAHKGSPAFPMNLMPICSPRWFLHNINYIQDWSEYFFHRLYVLF